jgi:hypothetical protein
MIRVNFIYTQKYANYSGLEGLEGFIISLAVADKPISQPTKILHKSFGQWLP